ncbi:MAG: hypothetical protein HY401_08320 [Elusimicrobia bacterium]|nr:hypothetical protein [Elusimicrobiota bacterium]
MKSSQLSVERLEFCKKVLFFIFLTSNFQLPTSNFLNAAKAYPIFDSKLMLGQYFFEGKPSSWGGNIDASYAHALRFSEELSFVPLALMRYQGTKSVTDLAGGGQLFQDSASAAVQMKTIIKRGKLKFKPSLGYRKEMLRESKDEAWGDGLFDFAKPSAGMEFEYVYSPERYGGFSFDFYQLKFPNYQSLESQRSELKRENAQARILDSNNYVLGANWSLPLPVRSSVGILKVDLARRDYPYQNIVLSSGELSNEERKDGILTVSLVGRAVYRMGRTTRVGLGAVAQRQRYASNQNHYDSRGAKFTADYYDYKEETFKPKAEFAFGRAGAVYGLTLSYTRRQYLNRKVQDAGGRYLTDNIFIHQRGLILDVAFPLAGELKLLLSSSIADSSSNMAYEKIFRYNYTLSNHLLGFSYGF